MVKKTLRLARERRVIKILVKVLLGYLVIVNLVLFFLMLYDKRQAVKNAWRVPEARLLGLAVIGGGLGGFIASRLFHHKTRKIYFTLCFAVGMIELLAILVWLVTINSRWIKPIRNGNGRAIFCSSWWFLLLFFMSFGPRWVVFLSNWPRRV